MPQPNVEIATPPSLESSHEYCENLTRLEAKNFFHAFWLLPPDRRRAIYSIYAFSRRLDDIVDGDAAGGDGRVDREEALARIAVMRELLDRNEPTDDPLAPALRDTIARYRIPLEHFDELIAGMVMDLENYQYATSEDLERYCYRAASTIGLICVEVFGHDGEPGSDSVTRPAVKLGLAMQLTNILRDVKEDLERGRLYLPANEVQRFGVDIEALRRGEVTQGFRELMRFQVERARRWFEEATPLFSQVDRHSRHCPMLLRDVYRGLLRRIERANYDVFHARPRLTRFTKLRLLARLWLRSKLARA